VVSIVSRLRRLAERVGRVPSAGFALAYLAAIPVFAMFYFLFADDFYYAAAKYDTVVLAQADGLARRLRDTYRADARLPPIHQPTLREALFGPVMPPDQEFKIRFESDRVVVVVSGEFPRRDTRRKAWFGTAVLDPGAGYFEKPSSIKNWETQLLSVYVTPRVITGYPDEDIPSVFPYAQSSGACLRMTGPTFCCSRICRWQELGA
jgi:hypothetical protein